MRVFILDPDVTHNPRFDTKTLAKYGEITPIFEKPFMMNVMNTPAALKALRRGLEDKEYDPFNDYICFTGPFHAVNLLIWALARTYEPIRVLMFDARRSEYMETVLTEDPNHVQIARSAR